MFRKIFLLVSFAFVFSLVPFGGDHYSIPARAQQVPAPNLDSGGFMFNLTPITHQGIEGSVKQSWIRRGINYFFERIIGVMAAIIGTLCVLMLSIGGFILIFSGGNDGRQEQGKNYITYALIGLAATLGAYILVTLVQLFIRSIYG